MAIIYNVRHVNQGSKNKLRVYFYLCLLGFANKILQFIIGALKEILSLWHAS